MFDRRSLQRFIEYSKNTSNSCLAITKAMEQFLIQRFLGEHPDLSDRYIHELLSYNECSGEESNCETVLTIWDFYKSFKKKIRNGSLGKTAQFWMIYLGMMQN